MDKPHTHAHANNTKWTEMVMMERRRRKREEEKEEDVDEAEEEEEKKEEEEEEREKKKEKKIAKGGGGECQCDDIVGRALAMDPEDWFGSCVGGRELTAEGCSLTFIHMYKHTHTHTHILSQHHKKGRKKRFLFEKRQLGRGYVESGLGDVEMGNEDEYDQDTLSRKF